MSQRGRCLHHKASAALPSGAEECVLFVSACTGGAEDEALQTLCSAVIQDESMFNVGAELDQEECQPRRVGRVQRLADAVSERPGDRGEANDFTSFVHTQSEWMIALIHFCGSPEGESGDDVARLADTPQEPKVDMDLLAVLELDYALDEGVRMLEGVARSDGSPRI